MPKSRLSEVVGVQRVRVGGSQGRGGKGGFSEAWLVKGTSCKYVLVAVFLLVGCFVAAIVATQITFVSEKHKLVQEERAHQAMEVVLEKRFLEVGSLLENELRRRLKRTKLSEAVHAAVQSALEIVEYPSVTVYQGDQHFKDLLSTVEHMASDVGEVMHSFTSQMEEEAKRSAKLLSNVAKHLGGKDTELLIEDTAVDSGKQEKGRKAKFNKIELRKQRKAMKGKSKGHRKKTRGAEKESIRDRANAAKERMTKSGNSAIAGKRAHANELKSSREERLKIIKDRLKNTPGKKNMRKEADLMVERRKKMLEEQRHKGQESSRGKDKGQHREGAKDAMVRGDSSNGGSDFIQGRDLSSLLVRFFMRLNKIETVVFPTAVKTEITAIKDKHQDAVLKIEAESSTKREKSQKLRAHWDETIEELMQALEQDGVYGVSIAELNHASWMVDELLKELQNVIDVQDLKEPLFKLEEKFKSGEDADAIFVMKELQKMARAGDLPYEWVFGGSTGLTHDAAQNLQKNSGEVDSNLQPHRHGAEEGFQGEDGGPPPPGPGGPMGAPQYMWWREYPRQVDNPHWRPPPNQKDPLEFLAQELRDTRMILEDRKKHPRRGQHNKQRQHQRGSGEGEDDNSNEHDGPVDLERWEHGNHDDRIPPHLRNHTRSHHARRPRKSRRYGDFGRHDEEAFQKRGNGRGHGASGQQRGQDEQDGNHGDRNTGHDSRRHQGRHPPMPTFGGGKEGDIERTIDEVPDLESMPRGGFHPGQDNPSEVDSKGKSQLPSHDHRMAPQPRDHHPIEDQDEDDVHGLPDDIGFELEDVEERRAKHKAEQEARRKEREARREKRQKEHHHNRIVDDNTLDITEDS